MISFTVDTPAPVSLHSRPNMFSQVLATYPEYHWKQILRYRSVLLMAVQNEPYLLRASARPFSLPLIARDQALLRRLG